MKFKLLKDIEICGVTHKKEEIHEITDLDSIDYRKKEINWCFGFGSFWTLSIGDEATLID